MKRRSRLETRALILLPVILILALSGAAFRNDLVVLEIGTPEVVLPVSEGDVFVHTYVHSMYQVPVSEKFRIEDGNFRLVHVMTESEAALEYLGLESKEEPNVNRTCNEFTILAASIGSHSLRVKDRYVPLATIADSDGRIKVKLRRVALLGYCARTIWR
jgi:hypothetical protein